MVVIALDRVTKKYGRKIVLQDYSLQVHKGEMVAVTGPSGCGKSTLLNVIGLLEDIDGGKISISGYENPKPATSLSNKILRERINYLFQSFALVDEQTVEYNLRLALDGRSGAKKAKECAIDEVLERVGLGGFKKHKIFELSGGEQQRVAIARAWLKPCEIVLADEPTGSLDPENRDVILDMIKEMHGQEKTILIVTHDQVVAEKCQRVVHFSQIAR
ncbi:MAG: ABC transporter ATP-binding protein [Peptococcaceae bacterium]|nr:ABC transporter ATP-binding protein [Peptococcaceae bacterium]